MLHKSLACAALLALSFVLLAHADQHSFLRPQYVNLPVSIPKRVAIIGGGAGGSSAAYFLSRSGQHIEITLFEKSTRLGGRSTTIPAFAKDAEHGVDIDQEWTRGASLDTDDHALPPEYAPIELGASIFVSANRNLVRAAELFGLNTTTGGIGLDDDDSGVGTSIWDGQQFVYEGLDGSWWNSARMIWRYGYSPLTMRNLVGGLINTFTKLYDPSFLHRPKTETGNNKYKTISGFPWSTIESLAQRMKFNELTSQTAEAWFYAKGVGKLFIEEVIEAATRVNYGQTTNLMHALGGGVSLAASGAVSIVGGNWQIFDKMAQQSGAVVLHGMEGDVTGLVKFEGGWTEAVKQGYMSEKEAKGCSRSNDPGKWYLATRAGKGYTFDAVLMAAPFHTSGVAILNSPAATSIPPQKYVHLHVTILITSSPRPRSEAFGRGPQDKIPRTILTTGIGARRGGKAPDFNSLSYLRRLPRLPKKNSRQTADFRPPLIQADADIQDDKGSDFLVKLFSPARLSDERLAELFGAGTVKWVYRKEWDAYPVLEPTSDFPPIVVDEGLYYLNALEPAKKRIMVLSLQDDQHDGDFDSVRA
ncbi:hypothetical protein OC861_002529 [Tilletia horrida]|nr:hypothetical protein OC861_002529 [Tilletia horrida]